MKCIVILGVALLLVSCLLVTFGWMGFITYLQSTVAIVRLTVAGSVDEVAIYGVSHPDDPRIIRLENKE